MPSSKRTQAIQEPLWRWRPSCTCSGKIIYGLILKIRSGRTATDLSFRPATLRRSLYSLLHLAGVKAVNRKYETLGEFAVPLADLKNFRQLESQCPGHPEYRWTSGVETTSGLLAKGWRQA